MHETAGLVAPVSSLSLSDRVCVTGAGGFIGSAVVRALLARGCLVRALVRPAGDRRNLESLDVEIVSADVRDVAAVRSAVRGTCQVFHVAALYRFGQRHRRASYEINVGGTRNVLEAARQAGCERVVYTSTVGTLGPPPVDGRPADETTHADVEHLAGAYKRSKYVAEHEALRAAAEGLPVVIVQPTFPLGARDRTPTPSGKVVLDFLNGRMPAYVNTGLNVVDVDDVAMGHVLAADHGKIGRSYILGGENLMLREILGKLSALTGLPAPSLRLAPRLLLPLAYLSEWIEGGALGRDPAVPLEALRMSTQRMFFDDSRARRELGYKTSPAEEAIRKSVTWYLTAGLVRPDRARRIRLQGGAEGG